MAGHAKAIGKGISVKDACLGLTAKRWVNEEGTKIQLLPHKSRKWWKSWLANMGLFGTLHSRTTGVPVPVNEEGGGYPAPVLPAC